MGCRHPKKHLKLLPSAWRMNRRRRARRWDSRQSRMWTLLCTGSQSGLFKHKQIKSPLLLKLHLYLLAIPIHLKSIWSTTIWLTTYCLNWSQPYHISVLLFMSPLLWWFHWCSDSFQNEPMLSHLPLPCWTSAKNLLHCSSSQLPHSSFWEWFNCSRPLTIWSKGTFTISYSCHYFILWPDFVYFFQITTNRNYLSCYYSSVFCCFFHFRAPGKREACTFYTMLTVPYLM